MTDEEAAELRYETGMYKSLYELWEKRATEYAEEIRRLSVPLDGQAMQLLADDLDGSVGLYRKMPDGRMVEIHVKKIAMIEAALRAAAALSRS